jgi:hypothetical protein
VIGAAIVLLGGGIAAYLATRGDRPKDEVAQTPVVAPGPGSAIVTPPPPPPPPPEPKLPEWSTIEIDSTPPGATVTDLSNNQAQKAPARYRVEGSLAKRQYKLHLRGYNDSIVELTPSRPEIKVNEPLQKGAAPGGVVKTVVDTAGNLVPDLLGGGAVTHPDSGPKSPETKPESGSAAKPPPPKDDCNDPPCLKQFPGSGSG